MNFKDYNASYITPQQTLLQKLNAIIKFLLEHKVTNYYMHKLSYSYLGNEIKLIIINNKKEKITRIALATFKLILLNSLSVKDDTGAYILLDTNNCISRVYVNNGECSSENISSSLITSIIECSDSVEDY